MPLNGTRRNCKMYTITKKKWKLKCLPNFIGQRVRALLGPDGVALARFEPDLVRVIVGYEQVCEALETRARLHRTRERDEHRATHEHWPHVKLQWVSYKCSSSPQHIESYFFNCSFNFFFLFCCCFCEMFIFLNEGILCELVPLYLNKILFSLTSFN